MIRLRPSSALAALTLVLAGLALPTGAAAAAPPATASPSVLMGATKVMGQRGYVASGAMRAFRFATITAGSADRIHVYLDRGTRARTIFAALYSDTRGRPGRLLRSGHGHAVAGRWNAIPIATRQVARGARYWIAVLPHGGRLALRDQRTGRCGTASAATRGGSFPTTWPAGKAGGSCPASAYVSGRREQALLGSPSPGAGLDQPPAPAGAGAAGTITSKPPTPTTTDPPTSITPNPPTPPASPPPPPPPPGPAGTATIAVSNSPTGTTLQTQLSTNDVWPFLMNDGPSTTAEFNALHAPLVRIHAGDDGGYPALPELKQNQWSFTNLNELVNDVFDSGQAPLMNPKFAPDWQWTCTSLGASGTVRDQTFQQYAQYLARLVDYYNNGSMTTETGQTIVNPAGTAHRIVYWEPWNEPDLNNETPCAPPIGNALTPQQYVTMWNAVTAAMLQKDPGLKFVGPATAGSQFGSSTTTGNQYVDLLMANSVTKPSAISFHGYGYWDNTVTDKWLFDGDNTEPAAKCCGGVTDLLQGIKTIRASYPSLPVWLTEVNVNADWGADTRKRPSSELAAAWWGVLFQQTAPAGAGIIHQYNVVDGPQFGLIDDQTSATYIGYHVFQLLNDAFPQGSSVLGSASNSAGVLSLAARKPDGKISVMVVNRQLVSDSAKSTCGAGGVAEAVTVTLSGITPGTVTRRQIDKTNVNCSTGAATAPAPQTLDPALPLTATLPGYGITVFELTGG